MLIDGRAGTIQVGVTAEEAKGQLEEDHKRRELIEQWEGPGRLADGTRIELLANVRDGESAQEAASVGAQGIGLLRTELCLSLIHI